MNSHFSDEDDEARAERLREEQADEEYVAKETTMVGLTERAARPLIQEQNPIIREKVIESVKKCLESRKKPRR
jgi:hypothetical protein